MQTDDQPPPTRHRGAEPSRHSEPADSVRRRSGPTPLHARSCSRAADRRRVLAPPQSLASASSPAPSSANTCASPKTTSRHRRRREPRTAPPRPDSVSARPTTPNASLAPVPVAQRGSSPNYLPLCRLWSGPGHAPPRDPLTTAQEFTVPWTEPAGDDTWRVRYRRADGTKGAISGFPSATPPRTTSARCSTNNEPAPGSTPKTAAPPSPNSPPPGSTPSTSTNAPKRTTAASSKSTSSPAGATPPSPSSPTSASAPGRRNSAPPAWRRPRSTASSNASRSCSPTPSRRS